MDFLSQVIHTFLHLSPDSVNALAHQVGPWLHVLLFGIILFTVVMGLLLLVSVIQHS